MGVAAWKPLGLGCAGFWACARELCESVGDAIVLEVGVGVIEVKPTMPFRFEPCVAETGLGAANCVLEVVLTVEAGGGMANWADDAGAGAGVADWKSSKSSSSAGWVSRISSPLLPLPVFSRFA